MFERLLARLSIVAPGRYIVKGGYALDIRLHDRARATKDLDLSATESRGMVVRDIATVSEIDVGDLFSFEIVQTDALDNIDGGSAVRFRVRVRLAERRFDEFDLDVGFDQLSVVSTDRVVGSELLTFAEIPPVEMDLLPIEQHVAEKIHAYTRIYQDGQQSSRVKDLVDIVLLAELQSMNAAALSDAIGQTFIGRGRQLIPTSFPRPPVGWEIVYRELASTVAIAPHLEVGWRVASGFLNPVLGARLEKHAQWTPEHQRWLTPGEALETAAT